MSKKTTLRGYINRNSQLNLGPTGKAGNHLNQKEYLVECLDCRHEYGANGCDLHERQCPQRGSHP